MLEFKDYLADWPDLPYNNFIEFLDGIAAKWPDKDATLFRSGKQTEFSRWTFSGFRDECQRVARGLLAAGLQKGDRVALWAENRPEWMAVWMGTAIAGCVIVPVDFLSSEKEFLNILTIVKPRAFFHSSKKRSFASSLESRGVTLENLIELPGEEEGAKLSYEDFGRGDDAVKLPGADTISPHDPVSIVFTSGTTGFAKGVTLHHKGIIANVNAAVLSLRAYPTDVFINVLPLHHTYPTTCSFLAPLAVGAGVIIVEKLVGKVVIDDIRDGGGTFLIAVPLLYDKVKAGIEQKYQKLPGIIRKPLDVLRKIALDKSNNGHIEFGQRVFRFIRKKAGLASIRIMVAGGGPLSIKTADFFDSLGFNMVQGYGMSENSPLISVNTSWHKRNASVGLPVDKTRVKIIDQNEEGIGEITAISPSIMLGYYENPEATREILTEDGWLLTGDLGYIDDDGFLHISGRKKNLIVSSGGKNVYPEEIEAHFDGSRVIGQILILARKEKDTGGEQIFAVTVPNFEALGEDYPDKELDDAFLWELIKKEIEGKNRALATYKKIVDFAIRRDPLEMNAQQKIRRFLYQKEYETPETLPKLG